MINSAYIVLGRCEINSVTVFLFMVASDGTDDSGDDEQGSGLGLIVCREFKEKHGSTLRVESEEGACNKQSQVNK